MSIYRETCGGECYACWDDRPEECELYDEPVYEPEDREDEAILWGGLDVPH